MADPQLDPLSYFVKRRIREQNLSRRDVSVRSGGEIAESYVGAIMNGTCTNVSIDKLRALARGIGVGELELARIALGRTTGPAEPDSADFDHSLILVDLRKKAVISSDVGLITQLVMELTPRERTRVLKFVKRVAKDRPTATPKHRLRRVR
jgi:transcriptional regulator with XRE-family HTH domain